MLVKGVKQHFVIKDNMKKEIPLRCVKQSCVQDL